MTVFFTQKSGKIAKASFFSAEKTRARRTILPMSDKKHYLCGVFVRTGNSVHVLEKLQKAIDL